MISEEKPETTYLDAIWLEQDGSRFLPTECQSKEAPTYCALDGERYILHEGETLLLHFRVPQTQVATTLWGHGFYIPVER